uniref:Uncharacterized protein n=1 Tax=Heterosigma akashiwo TaxID=2829 RepID=A0A7S3XUW6_HETAK
MIQCDNCECWVHVMCDGPWIFGADHGNKDSCSGVAAAGHQTTLQSCSSEKQDVALCMQDLLVAITERSQRSHEVSLCLEEVLECVVENAQRREAVSSCLDQVLTTIVENFGHPPDSGSSSLLFSPALRGKCEQRRSAGSDSLVLKIVYQKEERRSSGRKTKESKVHLESYKGIQSTFPLKRRRMARKTKAVERLSYSCLGTSNPLIQRERRAWTLPLNADAMHFDSLAQSWLEESFSGVQHYFQARRKTRRPRQRPRERLSYSLLGHSDQLVRPQKKIKRWKLPLYAHNEDFDERVEEWLDSSSSSESEDDGKGYHPPRQIIQEGILAACENSAGHRDVQGPADDHHANRDEKLQGLEYLCPRCRSCQTSHEKKVLSVGVEGSLPQQPHTVEEQTTLLGASVSSGHQFTCSLVEEHDRGYGSSDMPPIMNDFDSVVLEESLRKWTFKKRQKISKEGFILDGFNNEARPTAAVGKQALDHAKTAPLDPKAMVPLENERQNHQGTEIELGTNTYGISSSQGGAAFHNCSQRHQVLVRDHHQSASPCLQPIQRDQLSLHHQITQIEPNHWNYYSSKLHHHYLHANLRLSCQQRAHIPYVLSDVQEEALLGSSTSSNIAPYDCSLPEAVQSPCLPYSLAVAHPFRMNSVRNAPMPYSLGAMMMPGHHSSMTGGLHHWNDQTIVSGAGLVRNGSLHSSETTWQGCAGQQDHQITLPLLSVAAGTSGVVHSTALLSSAPPEVVFRPNVAAPADLVPGAADDCSFHQPVQLQSHFATTSSQSRGDNYSGLKLALSCFRSTTV